MKISEMKKICDAIDLEVEKHKDQYNNVTDKFLFAESVIDSMKLDGKFVVEHITKRERFEFIEHFENLCEGEEG
jgi:hypothetical protein